MNTLKRERVMKALFYGLFFISLNVFSAGNFYDFKVNHGEGGVINFSEFKGKVVVLTNIATRCGFTDQLDDLETIYAKYKDKNVVVLGIPSNNFLSQTPEANKEVVQFCKLKYKTNFPITEKVDVIGDNKHPIIKWVNGQKGFESPILWNFEKFIIGKDGLIIDRFRSITKPTDKDVIAAIEKALN